ncbi:MAG: hypothetical protein ABSF92_13005 [Candidatus Acidiferrales bacterium]|jgi:hypothetical protein
MWSPPSLLHPEVIETLEQADFPPEYIEFLGWLSGNAFALNNSRNPAKAAHTLLAKEKNVVMLEKFFKRKKESVKPAKPASHASADEALDRFREWKDETFPEWEPRNHEQDALDNE